MRFDFIAGGCTDISQRFVCASALMGCSVRVALVIDRAITVIRHAVDHRRVGARGIMRITRITEDGRLRIVAVGSGSKNRSEAISAAVRIGRRPDLTTAVVALAAELHIDSAIVRDEKGGGVI